MKTLMEMIQEAQSGSFQQNLANQFGISQQQSQQVLEALMPAFSRGLKQNAADPMDFASFMAALSSGKHAQYADDASAAFSGSGLNDGNSILGHLFGSKEVSRAIAANAAAATGIGETVLKQMLPAIAPVIMGALFKNMSGQNQSARFGGIGNNPLGQIFEQMMGAGRQGSRNPLEDLFGQMMGGSGNRSRGHDEQDRTPKSPLEEIFGRYSGQDQERTSQPAGIPGMEDNPLGKIFGEMMRGGFGQDQRQQRENPTYEDDYEEELPPGKGGSGGFGDLFGEMFESGRKVQKDYQKGIDDIFDRYLDGMRNRR